MKVTVDLPDEVVDALDYCAIITLTGSRGRAIQWMLKRFDEELKAMNK